MIFLAEWYSTSIAVTDLNSFSTDCSFHCDKMGTIDAVFVSFSMHVTRCLPVYILLTALTDGPGKDVIQ